FGPAEQAGIEIEGLRTVAGIEFPPADVARRAPRRRLRCLVARALEQDEACTVWVGHHGKAADPWNILRIAVNGAAGGLDARRVVIDVVYADISHPAWPHAHGARTLRDWHQTADHRRSNVKKRVAPVGHAGVLHVPSDRGAIEGLGSLGVG